MKLVHHLWLTVHCKEEDNEEDILTGLRSFFPFALEDKKVSIKRTSAQGFEERKIIIFQVHLEKSSHTTAFLSHLLQKLNDEQKELLIRQKESRLDEGNHFFIRFDKKRVLEEGKYFIVDDGNCYHLKMSLAAYPATREKAMSIIENLFAKS